MLTSSQPRPVLVEPPGELPVSLDVARDYCKAGGDDDQLVELFLLSAVAHLDGWHGILGRCLVKQRWRTEHYGWWGLRFPFPDVSAATITYRDAGNVEQTLPPTDHRIEVGRWGPEVVWRPSWTGPGLYTGGAAPITLTFEAGFGSAADVPAPIKTAILMLTSHFYDNRGAAVVGTIAQALPMGIAALLAPWRRVPV